MSTFKKVPIIYPAHINRFRECPERYFHQHIERRRTAEPFSRALAKGIAIHEVLAQCFTEYKHQRTFPIDLEQRATQALHANTYSAEEAQHWAADLHEVVRGVQWALSQFDGTATLVGIEETLSYRYRGDAHCPAFLLRAKVDLVLANSEGTLEAVDFKSGKVKRDPVQEVAARVVVNATHGPRSVPVRTTTHFVGEKISVSDVLTLESCRATWRDMTQAVNAILAGATWKPNASPLCNWCPYFGNGCSLDAGGTDPEWVDGAAD